MFLRGRLVGCTSQPGKQQRNQHCTASACQHHGEPLAADDGGGVNLQERRSTIQALTYRKEHVAPAPPTSRMASL